MTTQEPSLNASWAPSVCALPTVDRPLREQEFDELFATSVTGVDRASPLRVRMLLRPDPAVAALAAELAMRESGCCSFFTFTLLVSGGELALIAEVTEPYAAVLDALTDRAQALSPAGLG